MDEFSELIRVPIQLTHGCLVASIQTDLDERILEQFQKDLLERIQKTHPAGVILDLSGLAVIDAHEFAALRRTIAMAKVMGAGTVITGLQPGVVSSLVDMDVDCSGLQTTLVLEDAFDRIQGPRGMEPREPSEVAEDSSEQGEDEQGESHDEGRIPPGDSR